MVFPSGVSGLKVRCGFARLGGPVGLLLGDGHEVALQDRCGLGRGFRFVLGSETSLGRTNWLGRAWRWAVYWSDVLLR